MTTREAVLRHPPDRGRRGEGGAGDVMEKAMCLLRQRAPPRDVIGALRSTDKIECEVAQSALLQFLHRDRCTETAPYASDYVSRVLQAMAKQCDEDGDVMCDELADCLMQSASASSHRLGCHLQESETHDGVKEGWVQRVFTYRVRCEDAGLLVGTTAGDDDKDDNDGEHGDGGDNYFSLMLSENLFEGSTGCHEWDAGFFLCEWLMRRFGTESPVSACECGDARGGGRVVELGCGAGLLGMFLARESPRRMNIGDLLLTDGDADAVENATKNIRNNGFPDTKFIQDLKLVDDGVFRRDCSHTGDTVSIVCSVHNWEEEVPLALRASAQFVLATDVIYAPESIEPLVSTISQFISRDAAGDAEAGPAAIVCNELRTQSSLDLLEEIAERYGFSVLLFDGGAGDAVGPFQFLHHRSLDRASMRVHLLLPRCTIASAAV